MQRKAWKQRSNGEGYLITITVDIYEHGRGRSTNINRMEQAVCTRHFHICSVGGGACVFIEHYRAGDGADESIEIVISVDVLR